MHAPLSRRFLFAMAFLFPVGALRSADLNPTAMLKKFSYKSGICALVDMDAKLAEQIAQQTRLTVYLQLSNSIAVKKARESAMRAGLLGTRLYIEHGKSDRAYLADNIADILILPSEKTMSKEEVSRVTHNRSELILGGLRTIPYNQGGVDSWSHPYHGPDNNPLSMDRVAKAPYLTQFLAKPYYGPMPEVTVSANGRLFKAFGHIAFKEREWDMLSKLVAMNAYNGTELWRRELKPGFMIHRNTMLAYSNILLIADNESCKRLSALDGSLIDEIVISRKIATGPSWKWMALGDGALFALLGKKDKIDTVLKGNRKQAGWPWSGMGKAYAAKEYPWGFGRTLIAMEARTKRMIWHRTFEKPIDSRALCLTGRRIYAYSHKNFLTAIDSGTGKTIWSTTDPKVLNAIGEHDKAQTWRRGYSSQTYMKSSEKALYFAGPQRRNLVAVSTKDGSLLWSHTDGNYQLVIRKDAVYAMGKTSKSKKLDPLTGKVLAELDCLRGNCTRATGTPDSIFARGDQHGGTLRLTLKDDKPHRIPAMRPACQDGVIIANGLCYWGPWMCDCNHSLVGVISLGPAGKFNFEQKAVQSERLIQSNNLNAAAFRVDERDWPTYRANNLRSAHTTVSVPEKLRLLWTARPEHAIRPTAPISANGLTFVAGSDGIVRALDSKSGKPQWHAFTGGSIHYPPALWEGRLYVGSGDGWVYAFEASTGREIWKFRAAPIERKIPVYGNLMSTWPVATGVLVEDGKVYVGAGIASHDGTHVYSLDAKTGAILWQNNRSGHMGKGEVVAGVSVQGHMLMHNHRLYMAGGNVVSPAEYDPKTGKCANVLKDEWQKAPRGSELFVTAGKIRVVDQMMYSPRDYIPSRYYAKYMLQAAVGDVIIQGTESAMMRVERAAGGKFKVIWKHKPFDETSAVVLTKNGVLALGRSKNKDKKAKPISSLTLLNIKDGKPLWTQPLPAQAALWGLAVDRNGQILVTLSDGRVLCYGN